MTFSINVVKEESNDPYYKIDVSLFKNGVCIVNSQVDLIRLPPGIRFHFTDELLKILSRTDRHMLELEILNKVAEYIIETASNAVH